MNRLHQKLLAKSQTYQSWHSHPRLCPVLRRSLRRVTQSFGGPARHPFWHWTAFLSIAVLAAFYLMEAISNHTSRPLQTAHAAACDYYASPTGGGNGLTQSSPFQITNFWAVAAPGKTLCLLDGTYTGASSMIAPTMGLSGSNGSPITVKALNDGAVFIDGQNTRAPVVLDNNDWWIIDGLNAANSSGNVVLINTGSNHDTIRRVVAWNAAVAVNNSVWLTQGDFTLFEDVAGFGTGRKIFSAGNDLTIRRAWGMWNKSTWNPGYEAPKEVFSSYYDTYNGTCENCIGTWDNDAGTLTVDQYGIFSTDRFNLYGPGQCANTGYYGSIAYMRSGQSANFYAALRNTSSGDCQTFENVVAYLETSQLTTGLNSWSVSDGGPSNGGHILANVTEIGPGGADIGSDWTINNRIKVATVAEAPNIWNGTGNSGARVCYRYVDRKLTGTPLWPWPMNQRIIDALKAAGRAPIDITATMEQIFGPIPSQCRSGSMPPPDTTPPSPPANVRVQ